MTTAFVYVGLGGFFAAAIALWIYAFRDLARNTTFSEGSKRVWFWVVLLGPVGGSVAYLSAKRNVEKYSQPDAARLGKLLNKE
jgi:hypothetical protein